MALLKERITCQNENISGEADGTTILMEALKETQGGMREHRKDGGMKYGSNGRDR